MELMGKDTVLSAIKDLTGWEYRDNAISKTFKPGGFNHAVTLLNRIAEKADEQQHHPDMTVTGGGELVVTLSTHSAGGVTQNDIKLATAVEAQAQQG